MVTMAGVALLAVYVSILEHQMERHDSHIQELERRLVLAQKHIFTLEDKGCLRDGGNPRE